METNLAPVVLFVYNRPAHTLRTLEALQRNSEAKDTILYIFCDGPKVEATENTLKNIQEVKEIIQKENWCKEVKIYHSEHNLGLEQSIRKGIGEVFKLHDQIIVLEDDILVHPFFLTFMNKALSQYKTEENVKQISGYVEQVWKTNSLEAFFMPHPSSWGWATWKRVWNAIDFYAEDYVLVKEDKGLAYKFDLYGAYPYSQMLINQKEMAGFNSWAIFFCWSIFKQNGIVLYPSQSLVINLGFDGSGFHGDKRRGISEAFHFNATEFKLPYFPKPIIDVNKFSQMRMNYLYGMEYTSPYWIVNQMKLCYIQLISHWKIFYISIVNFKNKFF